MKSTSVCDTRPSQAPFTRCDTELDHDLWVAPSMLEYFEVSPSGGRVIVIKPLAALDRRIEVVPLAIWEVSLAGTSYLELNTMMGRLHFSSGTIVPKAYEPFSHDKTRKLRALFLTLDRSFGVARASREVAAIVNYFAKRNECQEFGISSPSTDSIYGDVAPVLERTVGKTDFAELAWLYVLARCRLHQNRAVAEIGSHQGRTTAVLASAMEGNPPTAHLISIDPHEYVFQNRDIVRVNVQIVGEDARLIQIQNSPENLTSLLAPHLAGMVLLDREYDGHTIAHDIAQADRWVADRGWLVLRDHCPVEHMGEGADPRLMKTVQAVRDNELLATNYRVVGAVRSTIAFQKSSR